MRIYDISMDITSTMVTWPGDPPAKIYRKFETPKDPCNVSGMDIGVHTGTHVDAPKHFVHGAGSIEKIPLENLYGPCKVLEYLGKGSISDKDFGKADIEKGDIILLKTDNSRDSLKEFNKKLVHITEDAAKYLVKKKIRTVGIDYLSIAPFDNGEPVHKILLGAGITVIEGLRLKDVPEGEYTLSCLPLKIVGSDGAPARAILIED